MNEIKVYIVVEGQTEQTFIREILAPQFSYKGIYLYPVLIGSPGHKGGNIRFDRAKNDIGNFLKQRSDIYISTMFDYFRIETSWPGRADVKPSDIAIKKAEKIEEETLSKIIELFPDQNAKKRFIPYIEMHEFEALLFSNASVLANNIGINISKIDEIVNDYGNPEEINDNSKTAPSKRLQHLTDNKYRKVAMGKTIAAAIGIRTMRKKCLHFNRWLEKIELIKGDAYV
jgi:hypothetical protein